ncbi:MAG: NUDIX hydrolase [Oscillospiraceae bacterium]|nr:NUDIX hydrolase [Oscillospiraceae bacterium]
MDNNLYEKTLDSKKIYEGRIVELRKDTVLLPNGKEAPREVIRHPGGVCIAALENDMLYLVRQFRYPYNEILLEVPAGKLNWGEDPLECGKRELLEETGLEADEYTYLGKLYPSPAYLNEVIHMYLARGLTKKKQALDEDEFLEVVKMPLQEAVSGIMSGEIKDAKTQAAILKLKIITES